MPKPDKPWTRSALFDMCRAFRHILHPPHTHSLTTARPSSPFLGTSLLAYGWATPRFATVGSDVNRY